MVPLQLLKLPVRVGDGEHPGGVRLLPGLDACPCGQRDQELLRGHKARRGGELSRLRDHLLQEDPGTDVQLHHDHQSGGREDAVLASL